MAAIIIELLDENLHDWPVLHARVVSQAKHTPDDRVTLLSRATAIRSTVAIRLLGSLRGEPVTTLHHVGNTALLKGALVGQLASSPELAIAVASNPVVVLGKLGALGNAALLVGQQHLRGGGDELVADILARDGILLGRVLKLERPVEAGLGIDPRRLLHGVTVDLVVVAVRVCLGVHLVAAALLDDDLRVLIVAVAVATKQVDGRVDAHGKDVLVVLGEDTRRNNVAVLGRLTLVNGDDADHAGGARLDGDAAGLVELEGEDVLVVGEGADELDDKLAHAGDDAAVGAEVGVLPQDAAVLLVQTHHRVELAGGAVGGGKVAV